MGKIFEKIYRLVKTIPNSKVITYGEIAKKLGISPRVVGWALHQNKNPKIPCHRVVSKDGKIAKNYAFGGAKAQREKLLAEGVRFKDKMHIFTTSNQQIINK